MYIYIYIYKYIYIYIYTSKSLVHVEYEKLLQNYIGAQGTFNNPHS